MSLERLLKNKYIDEKGLQGNIFAQGKATFLCVGAKW